MAHSLRACNLSSGGLQQRSGQFAGSGYPAHGTAIRELGSVWLLVQVQVKLKEEQPAVSQGQHLVKRASPWRVRVEAQGLVRGFD
jgi:hypothetical protein